MFHLAETIWQQQERTLWSIDSSLTIVWILLVILTLIGFGVLGRLSRLRNIEREILDEIQKQTKMLQYLNDRAYDEAIKKKPIAPPPGAAQEVYRID